MFFTILTIAVKIIAALSVVIYTIVSFRNIALGNLPRDSSPVWIITKYIATIGVLSALFAYTETILRFIGDTVYSTWAMLINSIDTVNRPRTRTFEEVPDSNSSPSPSPVPEPVTVETFDWTPVIIAVSIALSVIALAFFAWVIYKIVDSIRRRRQQEQSRQRRWVIADDDLMGIESEYANIESDPTQLLTMPLIFETENSRVITFHALREEAIIIRKRSSESDDPDVFENKIDALKKCWDELKRQALKVGLPGITPKDRERAHNMMNMVMDESITTSERELWRDKLVEFLDEKIDVTKEKQGETMKPVLIDKINELVDRVSIAQKKTLELESSM